MSLPIDTVQAWDFAQSLALEVACDHLHAGVPLDFAMWRAARAYGLDDWPGWERLCRDAVECEQDRIDEERAAGGPE